MAFNNIGTILKGKIVESMNYYKKAMIIDPFASIYSRNLASLLNEANKN